MHNKNEFLHRITEVNKEVFVDKRETVEQHEYAGDIMHKMTGKSTTFQPV